MKQLFLIGYLIFFSGLTVLAQSPTKQNCPPNSVLVPVTYHFKDTDAQYAWIYQSLRPTLGGERAPISKNIEDGALKMTFCIPTPASTERLELKVGPRKYDLAVRPIIDIGGGAKKMSPIQLLKQPRPDWVIVKSINRLKPEASDLPSFEIELFNFGQAHPGGQVVFRASRFGYMCAEGSKPARVTVQVSLSGQRLQVASSDPEYPEELIKRNAELIKNINWCAGNFSLRADFGPTGRLPAGPIRIRYTLKQAIADGSTANPMDVKYYFTRDYRLDVIGEGIW